MILSGAITRATGHDVRSRVNKATDGHWPLTGLWQTLAVGCGEWNGANQPALLRLRINGSGAQPETAPLHGAKNVSGHSLLAGSRQEITIARQVPRSGTAAWRPEIHQDPLPSGVAGRACVPEKGSNCMPLYEYDCRKCKKRFTVILRMAELGKARSVRCPRCSSTAVHKCIEPFFAVTKKKS